MPSSYAIGDHFESFIKDQVRQGRYASASEVVRDGLRALEEREQLRAVKLESLRAELQRGAESGVGVQGGLCCSEKAHGCCSPAQPARAVKVTFSPAASEVLSDITDCTAQRRAGHRRQRPGAALTRP